MLDGITKNRIDTLRQILVGKLPDPKTQVEQITNGLIYKFMNDMDEESISMGGKSTYFSGKYQKYSWKNLLDSKTSGIEKLSLYSEAIEQMYNNENLPELFREIFKNSFLPFKDPSTLNMFLKEINEFHYSNSEKLGDAFEYLLSFMGSQGDAGQFRTPRHIIDFIVEIVNPQKNETILDPACGTAGFLISSYKHILKQNTKKNLGDGLTASDRKKIGENLNGYDISPDMVKMSLVNMYLHKFTNPKINEYDTLSGEDRWNEYYDVILANPPFFSPKGGIMPHNRFGVKSTKAEVLFVDYINEHLKPNGRAGIIVPEGVIFQTGTAYKQLKKKLLETSLIGVISLPAGVFQPYSGVKTSILILDKEKNKKNNKIFFINIKNDGFDLTANRKKGKENDLPKIVQLIKNDEISKLENVKKEEIVKNNFSLNYSSYKNDEIINSNYKLVLLKDYADLKRGTSITKEDITDGDIPVIAGGQKPAYFNNKSNRDSNCITVSSSGAYAGYVAFHTNPIFASDCFTIETNNPDLNQKFLFYLLKSKQELIYSFQTGGGQPHVYAKDFDKFKIPLPLLKKQNELVEELDGYQKIIDGCRQVIENYKPSIDIDPSWEMVELGSICDVKGGKRLPKGESFENDITKYPYIRVVDFEKYSINIKNIKYISEKIFQTIKNYVISSNDIFISIAGTIGLVGRVPVEFSGANLTENAAKLVLKDTTKISIDYLMFILGSSFVQNQIKNKTYAVGVPKLALERIKKIKIPVCPVGIQKKIVENIKQDFSAIENNQRFLEKNQTTINNKIDNIWSK
jgi:type I restriction enzyme M protein